MVHAALKGWGAEHPNILRYLDRLNREDVSWGIFSGFVLKTAGVRETADIDLLLSEGSFDAAASLLPNARLDNECHVAIQCVDGDSVQLSTREATAVIDGTAVQLMQPAPMYSRLGGRYHLAMTPLAANARRHYGVHGTSVFMANPADTVLAKAVMRRQGAGKQDALDMVHIAHRYTIDRSYLADRAQEIGLDEPANNFLVHHTGHSALTGSDTYHALAA
ncbi:MAG TPA: hypothetical protein VLE73_06890 [Candidatus Saccharimonadales bacterium]|nr:hypothetical protein [Candidatus Saccharimonadales bacterium]